MKRILCTALAALGLLLGSQQQASAWHKCSFGVGLNLSCEGANNSVLWGVMKGGPAPGQMVDGGYPGGGHDMASMPMDPMAGMISPSSYASNYSPYGRAMPAAPMPVTAAKRANVAKTNLSDKVRILLLLEKMA